MEEWKDIKGFEGLYQISNYGNVMNTKTQKLLIPYLRSNGYMGVTLYKNLKKYYLSVHRLVAIHFINNPENKRCVGHLDCNKLNNMVDNLYWCTHKENNNHPTTRKRRSKSMKGRRPVAYNPKKVYQYDKNGILICVWESACKAGENGYNRGNIQACCHNKRKTADGYIWSFNPL